MFRIRKLFKFEMAHQLFTSYSKPCHESIHGHSYLLEVVLSSERLDESGMVVDFGELKDITREIVDRWDHSLVMPSMFPSEYLDLLGEFNKRLIVVSYNPTAENMAKHIYLLISDELEKLELCKKRGVSVSSIRLHETSTGWAEYVPQDEQDADCHNVSFQLL